MFSSVDKFYRGVNTKISIEEAQAYMKDESIPTAENPDPLFSPRWLNIEGYIRTCMLASMAPDSHVHWPSTSNDLLQALVYDMHYMPPYHYLSVEMQRSHRHGLGKHLKDQHIILK